MALKYIDTWQDEQPFMLNVVLRILHMRVKNKITQGTDWLVSHCIRLDVSM